MAFNIFAERTGTFSYMLAENYSDVKEGDLIGKLEAFKLESDINAPGAGVLIWCTDVGAYVNEGDLLATISEETIQPEHKELNDKQSFWAESIAAANKQRRNNGNP